MQAYQREISRELSSFLLLSLSSSSDWSAQQPEGTDTSQNLCRLSINLTPSLDSPSCQMGCCSSAATSVLAQRVVLLCYVQWSLTNFSLSKYFPAAHHCSCCANGHVPSGKGKLHLFCWAFFLPKLFPTCEHLSSTGQASSHHSTTNTSEKATRGSFWLPFLRFPSEISRASPFPLWGTAVTML